MSNACHFLKVSREQKGSSVPRSDGTRQPEGKDSRETNGQGAQLTKEEKLQRLQDRLAFFLP